MTPVLLTCHPERKCIHTRTRERWQHVNTSVFHTDAFFPQRLLILSRAHLNMCPHTHTTTHLRTQCIFLHLLALVDTPHTEALPADISSSVFSLCVSLRPEERRGRCLLLAWQCRVVGGGGVAQRWVGVDWVCSATAHGSADNITGLTLSPTRAHTHTHARSWRAASFLTLNLIRAYVYGSEHMWPLFLRSPLRLPLRLFYLSINVSLCPSHGFLPPSLSDCLSSLIHFTFLAISIAACPSKVNKKNWQTVQLCPGGVWSCTISGKLCCKPPS